MLPTGLVFSPDAVDADACDAIGLGACRQHAFLPTFSHGLLLQVARPDSPGVSDVAAIRQLTHQEVRPFGVRPEDFAAALEEITSRCREDGVIGAITPVIPPQAWPVSGCDGRCLALELVSYAAACGASDLMVDDQGPWTDIAVQRSGRKEVLPPIERGRTPGLLRAFKEMAGLPTHNVLATQSGAARVTLAGGRRVDLRLEITPTVHGESLVARLQDPQEQLARLSRFPFRDPQQGACVRSCLAAGQGLIVATGPTGHGKTTTLYACLGQIDRSRVNVRTLEDPVEFIVPWITQIPVGGGTGRDFAAGLTSVLRQAPQVILLGEIRDRPAAATCLEAVDTGHLLLATLHTRDAIGVVSRLLDLGITGRQIASGLALAIGQRLLRRLCCHCRRACSVPLAAARCFEAHGIPVPAQLWAASGCERCGGRGEEGRVPVFELFCPRGNEAIENLVATATAQGFQERALRRLWLQSGGRSLAQAALALAAAGEVAHDEAAALAMVNA